MKHLLYSLWHRDFWLLLVCLPLLVGSGCAKEEVLSTDPKVLLDAAWDDFRLAEYDLALKKFAACRDLTEPATDEHLLALYGLATTWDLRQPMPDQDDARASELYEEILATAPDHNLAAWSQLALARMNHLVPVGKDPDYDVVRKGYEEVMAQFPEHFAGQEAFIYQNAIPIMTLEPGPTEEALASLEQFIADHPDSQFVSMAYNLCAIGYETLGRYDDQLAARLKELETLELDPTSPFIDNSWRYWQIATTAEFLAGNFDVARAYYQLLIDEYPVDVRTYSAEQAILRMAALEAELQAELEAQP